MHRFFPVFAFRTVFPPTFLSPSSSTHVILLLELFSVRFGSALFVAHWIAREAAVFFSCPYTLPFFVPRDLPFYIEGESNMFFLTLTSFIRAHSVSSQETVLSEMNHCMVIFRNPADPNKQSHPLVLLLIVQWNDVSKYWISTIGLIVTSPADGSVCCCLHKLIKVQ